MSEKPIIFNGEMVRAILDGRKTQTRSPVKPQPDVIYVLTDERLMCYHTSKNWKGELHESSTKANTNITEQRLHGWQRWEDLLSDAIRWIWTQGARGLVCATRSHKQSRLFDCFIIPQQPQNHESGPPIDLYGLSWDTTNPESSGAASEWGPTGQPPTKPKMGDSGGKLDGSQGTWKWNKWGEASHVKIVRRAEGGHSIRRGNGPLFPPPSRKDAGDVTVCYFQTVPWYPGMIAYVRETWWEIPYPSERDLRDGADTWPKVDYPATSDDPDYLTWGWKKRPSIHMPRWASRITLEVVDVRVERVQEIGREDAKAEGFWPSDMNGLEHYKGRGYGNAQLAFGACWKDIYPGSWERNDWVWVIEFTRTAPQADDPKEE